MKLSIIILNYKSKNLVNEFLQKVTSFNFEFPWEIIVVDNNSKDSLQELIEKNFPKIKFIANKRNIGMGAGTNIGIKNSTGQYILNANPDVILTADAIKKMVSFLDENHRVGVVAPKMLNPDKTKQTTCYRFPKFSTFLFRRTPLGRTKYGQKHLKHFEYQDTNTSQSREVDWVLGGCFMVRRETLDEVGMFDEKFFLFLEDTDLCRRVKQADWQVWYYTDASVIHLPHRLSAGEGTIKDLFSKMTWAHIISWLKYFWKWHKKD